MTDHATINGTCYDWGSGGYQAPQAKRPIDDDGTEYVEPPADAPTSARPSVQRLIRELLDGASMAEHLMISRITRTGFTVSSATSCLTRMRRAGSITWRLREDGERVYSLAPKRPR